MPFSRMPALVEPAASSGRRQLIRRLYSFHAIVLIFAVYRCRFAVATPTYHFSFAAVACMKQWSSREREEGGGIESMFLRACAMSTRAYHARVSRAQSSQ